MKSLKTYNMDHDCIRILKNQPNKSKYVCESIRLRDKSETEFDLLLVDTRLLMIHLKSRAVVSPQLKALLQHELSTQV